LGTSLGASLIEKKMTYFAHDNDAERRDYSR